ncbi:MAG: hypothetical protein K0Q55_1476 [Verrucomicrobia bacterium]|jgi:hypothetical protein|nr:hypothetical protein [Verrucomicrobiota bacterium]
MKMAELMKEVAGLPIQQQNELAAYLLHLRLSQDPNWHKEMGRRLDSKSSENWLSLDDWKKELESDPQK